MNAKLKKTYSLAVIVVCYFLIFAGSFYGSLALRNHLTSKTVLNPLIGEIIFELFVLSSALYLLLHLIVSVVVERIEESGFLSHRYIFYHTVLFSVLLFAALSIFHLYAVSRLFIVILVFNLFLFSHLFAWLLNSTLLRIDALRFDTERILLVGSDESNEILHQQFREERNHLKVINLDLPTDGMVVNKLFYAEIVTRILNHGIKRIYITMPVAKVRNFEKLLIVCDSMNVQVFVLASLMHTDASMDDIIRFDRDSLDLEDFINISQKETGQLSLRIKRLIDFSLALFSLVLFLPFFLIVPILIKLESKGPVFFVQERVGFHGTKFRMVKFRSMVHNAEELKQKLNLERLNEHKGPAFKLRNDPRITRVGAFLRKTSLDELPQLFNVLLGQMSMVGPRPPLMSEVMNYEFWHYRRLAAPPGITGLWQVTGRNLIHDFNDWVKLDISYINNWSIWLDIKILFRTVFIVFTGRGAA